MYLICGLYLKSICKYNQIHIKITKKVETECSSHLGR